MITPRLTIAGIAIATMALLSACGSDSPAEPAGTAPNEDPTTVTVDGTMMTETTMTETTMADTTTDGTTMAGTATDDTSMTEESVAP
jgi:hypothetical protein